MFRRAFQQTAGRTGGRQSSRNYYTFKHGEQGPYWLKIEMAALSAVPVALSAAAFFSLVVGYESFKKTSRSELFEAENPYWDATHMAMFRKLKALSGDEEYLEKHAPEVAAYLKEQEEIDNAVRMVEDWAKEEGIWEE